MSVVQQIINHCSAAEQAAQNEQWLVMLNHVSAMVYALQQIDSSVTETTDFRYYEDLSRQGICLHILGEMKLELLTEPDEKELAQMFAPLLNSIAALFQLQLTDLV